MELSLLSTAVAAAAAVVAVGVEAAADVETLTMIEGTIVGTTDTKTMITGTGNLWLLF